MIAGNGLGCKICFLAEQKTEFGRCLLTSPRQISLDRFRKHQATEVHLRSLARLVGCECCTSKLDDVVDSRDAPSFADFQRMLDMRRSGISLRKTGFCKKAACLQYCLGEALREQLRSALRSCVTIVTHADGKNKRFTMHFTAVDRDLEIIKSTFGHAWQQAAEYNPVEGYVRLVDQVLKNFCTPLASPPKAKRAPELFDRELYNLLREKHSAFNTDACKVIILAGQEVVNHLGTNPDPLFPNAVAWIKDHTHSARRRLGEVNEDVE